jgi:hypothetical protein
VDGEQAHRRAQVGRLARAVHRSPAAAALTAAAGVHRERGQAALVQPGGVDAGDLLLHAGERPGQDHRRCPLGGHGEIAGQRHAELRRRVAGITQKVLTETLRDMERDGLVQRRVLKATPPQHVEYSLTALGRTLQEPLAAICAWATENGA